MMAFLFPFESTSAWQSDNARMICVKYDQTTSSGRRVLDPKVKCISLGTVHGAGEQGETPYDLLILSTSGNDASQIAVLAELHTDVEFLLFLVHVSFVVPDNVIIVR